MNMQPKSPIITFLLATHNRSAVVQNTLSQLHRLGLERQHYEIIVVDNASTDGTPDKIKSLAGKVTQLNYNAGSCAKAEGLSFARGEFIVFLDDDSTPRLGAIERMIDLFNDRPNLGSAGFSVHLPNGSQEASALPGVFVGCGVGFRAEALRAVGGLDRSFFMQAEEFDVCFKLVSAGWDVEVFDELEVDHLKTPCSRRSGRTTFLDIRNNLRVGARYLPPTHHLAYRTDWLQRYRWLAMADRQIGAFWKGAFAGRMWAVRERWSYRSCRLKPRALEFFFRWAEIEHRMKQLAEGGAKSILLADLGKNIYAFHRGAQRAGLEIVAIADDRFSEPGREYRGIPIVRVNDGIAMDCDEIVVANTAKAHAQACHDRLWEITNIPIHCWFGSRESNREKQIDSQMGRRLSDVGV